MIATLNSSSLKDSSFVHFQLQSSSIELDLEKKGATLRIRCGLIKSDIAFEVFLDFGVV